MRYATAALMIGVMAALRLAAVPVMGIEAPLLPFSFAVFAAACVAGLGPALAATVLAVIVTTVEFANLADRAAAAAWAGHASLFLTLGSLVSLLVHRLQLAYRDQRLALAAATAREEQLRIITDALPAVIAYVDADCRYRFTNEVYEEWFGLSADELLGRHVREVVGEAAYAVIRPYIQRALAGEVVDFEAKVPYLAGGSRHVSAHYVPDRDSNGAVHGYFALVEDVSDRKHKEALLADTRLRLSLALRAGKSGAFEWDVGSGINIWSPELLELYGFSPDQLAHTREPWLECIHPDDLPRMRDTWTRMLAEGELDAEYRIRRRDNGEQRWLHARGQVSYDDARNPVRVLGINVDITERKRAEEAVLEADRRKDEFLSMLAHELRNPLAPIRTAGRLLVDERTHVDTMRRLGAMVQRQVANLSRIVDDLLDVARIRTGKFELRKEIVLLDDVLDHAVETLKGVLEERGQTVAVTRSSAAACVEGDPVRLEQVIVNLLANASKFSPENARIEAGVELDDATALLRIRDPGIGIEPQLLPLVFDLFVQAQQSLDRGNGGLGIGLTLVRWIVEGHGGTVEARSDGHGKGSEFLVRLPRVVDVTADGSPAPARRRVTA